MQHELITHVQAQLDAIHLPKDCSTWWRVFSINERTGQISVMFEQKNIIPYQGADVMARVLAGDITWAPGAVYFEYENTAGVVTVPTPTRDEDIDYYLSTLALEAAKDYIRIPLVVPAAFTASGADYEGNQATFWAVTSGTTGVHGKTFDKSVDSKVYGVALAATPTPGQYTLDKLFSRSYTGFDPVPKEDGYQIGAQYLIRFN